MHSAARETAHEQDPSGSYRPALAIKDLPVQHEQDTDSPSPRSLERCARCLADSVPLHAGLARIDNVFMMSRRLFSSLERPIGTSSGYNTVWHGYAPYNPRMLEKYLTIFRSMNNFVFVGDDGKAPAMCLGFAKQPLTYDDILWLGQRIPQRKRRRRKGKVIPGLRRVA